MALGSKESCPGACPTLTPAKGRSLRRMCPAYQTSASRYPNKKQPSSPQEPCMTLSFCLIQFKMQVSRKGISSVYLVSCNKALQNLVAKISILFYSCFCEAGEGLVGWCIPKPCWGSRGWRIHLQDSFFTPRESTSACCLILLGLQDAWASHSMAVRLLTW